MKIDTNNCWCRARILADSRQKMTKKKISKNVQRLCCMMHDDIFCRCVARDSRLTTRDPIGIYLISSHSICIQCLNQDTIQSAKGERGVFTTHGLSARHKSRDFHKLSTRNSRLGVRQKITWNPTRAQQLVLTSGHHQYHPCHQHH
jgi:hypothetical protein